MRRRPHSIAAAALCLGLAGPAAAQDPLTGYDCAGTAYLLGQILATEPGIFPGEGELSGWFDATAILLAAATGEDDGCEVDTRASLVIMEEQALVAVERLSERTGGDPDRLDAVVRDMADAVHACENAVGADRLDEVQARFEAHDFPCGWP